MGIDNNYTAQVVTELKGGELLYPRNIPADRGSTALIIQIVIILLLWGACIYFASQNRNYLQAVKYSWYCTTSNILLIILCSLISRIANLFEELRYIQSRYDGSIAGIFSSALEFNTLCIVIIVICIATGIGMKVDVKTPLEYLWSFGPEAYVFSLIVSILITRSIHPDESKLNDSLTLSRMKGLDYGSGMAYSYFYGYLKLILPDEGGESKGLLENINVWESQNKISIPVKKLFILIPTSLRIPPDLKEASNNWLKAVGKLEGVTKTRAGVKGRSYHNTVYKIEPEGRSEGNNSVYVITEGATPLQTFYEVLAHSGKDSTSYNDFRKEIAGSFYRTIRHIIRSKPETRDLCEFIFYEDVDPDQNTVNVAKILLDKIKEQTALAS